MANTITQTTHWYVWSSGGSELNGGGFDPCIASPGTNWAAQAAAHVLIDGATIVGTVAGAANILTGHSDTIATVVTNGTFSEAARNTDAGESNVYDGVSYKVLNVSKTGTASMGAVSINGIC
jgi:hypothetical protein